VDTSLPYGFKDDMVVRIQENAEGTRVDVHSMSRVGRSDLGVNAKRIRTFMTRLRSNLPAPYACGLVRRSHAAIDAQSRGRKIALPLDRPSDVCEAAAWR
jgi:hypothetical protein